MDEPMPQFLETSEAKRSTETMNISLRKSFSWNRAFFNSDGVLDAEELSSMIEGGGNDVNHQLQGIDDPILSLERDNLALERLEAKLLEDIKSSSQKSSIPSNLSISSVNVSSRRTDSRAEASNRKSNVPATSLSSKLSSLCSSTPTKMEPTRSSPLRGSSSGNNVKTPETLARRNTGSKTGKTTAGSTSKPPSGIGTKNKLPPVNSRLPTSSITQLSSESSSTSINRKFISRGSGGTNFVKSSATNGRTKVDSIPPTLSRIGLKNKPPPVDSHVSSMLVLNSSESLSSTSTVYQRRGGRRLSVRNRSLDSDASVKSAPKNRPTGRNSDRNGKQNGSLSRPSAQSTGRGMPSRRIGVFDAGRSDTPKGGIQNQSRAQTGVTRGSRNESSNSAKTRKPPPPKTVAADKGLKPNPRKSTTTKYSRDQTKAKARPPSNTVKGMKSLLVASPEVLDIKGKINALRIEIGMQKKDCFKVRDINELSSSVCMNSSYHDTNEQSSKDRHEGKCSSLKRGSRWYSQFLL